MTKVYVILTALHISTNYPTLQFASNMLRITPFNTIYYNFKANNTLGTVDMSARNDVDK